MLTMDFRSLLVDLLFLCWCHAQPPVDIPFMPGTSPANPNDAIASCRAQATHKELDIPRAGRLAEFINDWCSVYEGVLPCLDRTLDTAELPEEVYLKLIFNESMATKMSKSICARFPHISNLTCVESSLDSIGQCMKWSVTSAIDNFKSMVNAENSTTSDTQNLSAIYACIISVSTASCFHRETKTCPPEKRKLVYDFYVMFSGQCKEIAGIKDETTIIPSTPPVSNASVSASNNQSGFATEVPRDNGANKSRPPSAGNENRDYTGSAVMNSLPIGTLFFVALTSLFSALL